MERVALRREEAPVGESRPRVTEAGQQPSPVELARIARRRFSADRLAMGDETGGGDSGRCGR